MAGDRFQAASRDLNGPAAGGVFREQSHHSRADRDSIGRGQQERRRARELRSALRDSAANGRAVGDRADKEVLAEDEDPPRGSRALIGRRAGDRFQELSRDSIGLRVDRLAKEPIQDRERGRAGHLLRRVNGLLSRSLANRRADLIGRRAAAEDLEEENRGPENLARGQQVKVARAGPRRERDSNRVVDSGSRAGFLNLAAFQSRAARVALIAASPAEEVAGVHFGRVGGRGAGSAVES